MVGGHHGECGARVCNGSMEAEPPVGSRGRAPGQGVRGLRRPEAESILVIGCPTEPANLAPVRENSMLCYSPLVSELVGAECMVPPTPSLGARPVPPAAHRLRRLCKQTANSETVVSQCPVLCSQRNRMKLVLERPWSYPTGSSGPGPSSRLRGPQTDHAFFHLVKSLAN